MLAFVCLFWQGLSLSSHKMDLELEWQSALYHAPRIKGRGLDGWLGRNPKLKLGHFPWLGIWPSIRR